MTLQKGTVVRIIEANDDRILFEEFTPYNDAKIFRVKPTEDQQWGPQLAIEELRPREVTVK